MVVMGLLERFKVLSLMRQDRSETALNLFLWNQSSFSEEGKWNPGRFRILLLSRYNWLSFVSGRKSGTSLILFLCNDSCSQLGGMFSTMILLILLPPSTNTFKSLNCLYWVKPGTNVSLLADKYSLTTLTFSGSLCSSVSSSASVRFLFFKSGSVMPGMNWRVRGQFLSENTQNNQIICNTRELISTSLVYLLHLNYSLEI